MFRLWPCGYFWGASNSPCDSPESRSTQLLAALRAAAALKTGPAANKIDVNRQAVAGWSMGGGGTLIAATATRGLKAAVAFVAGTLQQRDALHAVRVQQFGAAVAQAYFGDEEAAARRLIAEMRAQPANGSTLAERAELAQRALTPTR